MQKSAVRLALAGGATCRGSCAGARAVRSTARSSSRRFSSRGVNTKGLDASKFFEELASRGVSSKAPIDPKKFFEELSSRGVNTQGIDAKKSRAVAKMPDMMVVEEHTLAAPLMGPCPRAPREPPKKLILCLAAEHRRLRPGAGLPAQRTGGSMAIIFRHSNRFPRSTTLSSVWVRLSWPWPWQFRVLPGATLRTAAPSARLCRFSGEGDPGRGRSASPEKHSNL